MSADKDVFFLTKWYEAQCDEDWEHQYGVTIQTLDNPGWHLTVALTGTLLEDAEFPYLLREITEHDWLGVSCKDHIFKAVGGPLSLPNLFEMFRLFVERQGANPLLPE